MNNNVNSQQMRDLLNMAYQQRLSQMLDPANVYAQTRQQQSQQQIPQLTQEQLEAIRNNALRGGRVPYPVQQSQMPQGAIPIPNVPVNQNIRPQPIPNAPVNQSTDIYNNPNVQLAMAEQLNSNYLSSKFNNYYNRNIVPTVEQIQNRIEPIVNQNGYYTNPRLNENLQQPANGYYVPSDRFGNQSQFGTTDVAGANGNQMFTEE